MAGVLALLSLGLSEPALAQQSVGCDTGFSITCNSTGNTYATGINNGTGSPSQALSISLEPGVHVVIPSGSPGVNAVNAANSTGVTTASGADPPLSLRRRDPGVDLRRQIAHRRLRQAVISR